MHFYKIALVLVALFIHTGCSEKERLYIKASLGSRVAMREYGEWLESKGNNEEYRESKSWYKKAAEKGDSRAMYFLAMCYGGGIHPSPEAVYWFTKGAEAGDPSCMSRLSVAYANGYLGLPNDPKLAKKWADAALKVYRERKM